MRKDDEGGPFSRPQCTYVTIWSGGGAGRRRYKKSITVYLPVERTVEIIEAALKHEGSGRR